MPTTRQKRLYAAARNRVVKLTPLERRVLDFCEANPDMNWHDRAKALDYDRTNLKRAYTRAKRKAPLEGQMGVPKQGFQKDEPEKFASLVNEITNPEVDETVRQIAKRLNLPESTAHMVAREIRSIYFPTAIEARKVKLQRLEDLWGMRGEEALAQLTPDRMAKASPKDLAIIAGVATDKLLLLRGRPTQIVRTEDDRNKIEQLAEAFLKEADRRGYNVSTNFDTGEVKFDKQEWRERTVYDSASPPDPSQ